ncbi:MAG TPA: DUF4837 family protein [Bacteroidales bacterium]|nr:DUF4837 family protein [Bacteroidales bacterium]
MKINLKILFIILVNIIFLSACNKKGEKVTLPASTGKTAELLVVSEQNTLNGIVGKQIKAVFAQEIELLPQSEPMFNIVTIAPSAFEGMFTTFRNIFIAEINPKIIKPTLFIKQNVWAQPQTVIQITAPSDTIMVKLLKEHGNVFISQYLKMERERIIKAFKNIETTSIRLKLKQAFGFEMIFPEGYYIATQEKNFAWIRKETETTSQNVIIYFKPFTDTSVFNLNNIIALRDSITKKHIPGPTDNSYMTTEKEFKPVYKAINFNGKYAIETRGLWRLEESCCMGGPFINYTFVDNNNKLTITIDVFIYAPSTKKRDLLLQVEAIAYTFKQDTLININ